MHSLKLPENLAKLRRERKITQEELADFIGVTKASVSKWENGQSMPDILLLPQLAAYYNVSLDDLFGYEPQLSKEQIQKTYRRFASAFATRPFDEVMAEVRETAHQYYACYPLLLQLCVLYLNHFPMAKDAAQMQDILQETKALCAHILRNCASTSVLNDAASVQAVIDLQLGNTDGVIEALEPLLDPLRCSKQDDATLIQAYRMAGKTEQALDHAQITMYLNLLSFVSTSVQSLSLNGDNRQRCEKTVRRIGQVAGAYRLDRLHPNVMAQFYYQAAAILAGFGENEQALELLRAYAGAVHALLGGGAVMLHGDEYFDRLGPWFEKLALGPNPPRDQALIRQSVIQSLALPAFDPIRDTQEFRTIQAILEKE